MLSSKSFNFVANFLKFSKTTLYKNPASTVNVFTSAFKLNHGNPFQFKSLTCVNSEFFGIMYKKKHCGPCLPHKTKSKFNSPKRRPKRRAMNYRLTNHRGLLKRIRIVGPRHDRKFKFISVGKRHGMRKRSRSNLRRKRRVRFIKKCDYRRVRRMIPLFKRQRFKAQH